MPDGKAGPRFRTIEANLGNIYTTKVKIPDKKVGPRHRVSEAEFMTAE